MTTCFADLPLFGTDSGIGFKADTSADLSNTLGVGVFTSACKGYVSAGSTSVSACCCGVVSALSPSPNQLAMLEPRPALPLF